MFEKIAEDILAVSKPLVKNKKKILQNIGFNLKILMNRFEVQELEISSLKAKLQEEQDRFNELEEKYKLTIAHQNKKLAQKDKEIAKLQEEIEFYTKEKSKIYRLKVSS